VIVGPGVIVGVEEAISVAVAVQKKENGVGV
jgi:hypothetical protein